MGAVLVPHLLENGYSVTVFDLMIYGDDVLPKHPNLQSVKGDIRDQTLLMELIPGHDVVIHLACISNDPSFELNPELGKSINLDAFRPLVEISKNAGIQRFIYASSSSVYGIKDEPDVHEEMSLEPLTDYSRFKADCENILAEYQSEDFTTVTIRPATVCGYSPRQRLDVVVNILTNMAYHKREISVFGLRAECAGARGNHGVGGVSPAGRLPAARGAGTRRRSYRRALHRSSTRRVGLLRCRYVAQPWGTGPATASEGAPLAASAVAALLAAAAAGFFPVVVR